MTQTSVKSPYDLAHDEKVTPVMVYTMTGIFWGDVITKEKIRVGAWLRTDMAPAYVHLRRAQSLILAAPDRQRPRPFNELLIPISEVVLFHVLPKVKEPLYYDPNEPNRVLDPVTIQVGMLVVDGHLRISTNSTFGQVLDVIREPFISIFEAKITHPRMPPPGVFEVPYVIVRRSVALFGKPAG